MIHEKVTTATKKPYPLFPTTTSTVVSTRRLALLFVVQVKNWARFFDLTFPHFFPSKLSTRIPFIAADRHKYATKVDIFLSLFLHSLQIAGGFGAKVTRRRYASRLPRRKWYAFEMNVFTSQTQLLFSTVAYK